MLSLRTHRHMQQTINSADSIMPHAGGINSCEVLRLKNNQFCGFGGRGGPVTGISNAGP